MLSKAAPREHIHTRQIVCRGYRREDGLWDIEATLEDSKSYSFANHDRGGIAAGEPIHRMHVRLTLDADLVVKAAEAWTEAGPFGICGDINPAYAGLVGLKIGRGWRRQVAARLAGVHGCTHLTDLVTGPLAQTALQTIASARARRHGDQEGSARPEIIDSCHAFASEGPIVAREYPSFSTAKR